mmetsp:Transcript_47510/g.141905  ORF Transcript_47510/g.141905 Transcript_47510/m.141905 type:complete len:212 (-) Transcript_47510:567-1202(-)
MIKSPLFCLTVSHRKRAWSSYVALGDRMRSSRSRFSSPLALVVMMSLVLTRRLKASKSRPSSSAAGLDRLNSPMMSSQPPCLCFAAKSCRSSRVTRALFWVSIASKSWYSETSRAWPSVWPKGHPDLPRKKPATMCWKRGFSKTSREFSLVCQATTCGGAKRTMMIPYRHVRMQTSVLMAGPQEGKQRKPARRMEREYLLSRRMISFSKTK